MDCDISSNISVGNFDWCNKYPGKWILSPNNNILQPEKRIKISLFITVNHLLRENTNFIYIHNMNNYWTHQTKNSPSNCFNMTLKIHKENIGSNIIIQFFKNPSGNTDGYSERPFDFKNNLQLTHEIIYNVSDIRIYGEDTDCNICLDKVEEPVKYVSPCGHLFHMGCIWDHIIFKRMFRLNYGCLICTHQEQIPTNFTCPVCNELITS